MISSTIYVRRTDRDPSEPVYMMTVWGFRILPLCMPFSPAERQELAEDDDPVKNIGIRMVFGMARDVKYQNVMGLNVLTIRI